MLIVDGLRNDSEVMIDNFLKLTIAALNKKSLKEVADVLHDQLHLLRETDE